MSFSEPSFGARSRMALNKRRVVGVVAFGDVAVELRPSLADDYETACCAASGDRCG
jgi:hypothetical protein